MGNRAIVVFESAGSLSPGVYLHWNGSPESIYAFLAEHQRRKNRVSDVGYSSARFCHLIGDFFDQDETGTTSLGLFEAPASLAPADLAKIDPGDNGVYVVSPAPKNPDFSAPGDWNGLRVRRFHGGFSNKSCQEATPEDVQAEREQALKHDYHPKIAAVFAKIRPKIGD